MEKTAFKEKINHIVNFFKRYFGCGQNSVALLVTLFAAATIFIVLFASPRPGAVDFGEYDQTLYRMGLSRTVEDENNLEERYFTKVIETFVVDGVDGSRLLASNPTESMVYPVAVVSGICHMFSTYFSTFYLAILYVIILLISIYVISKSLYHYLSNKVVFFGVLLCVMLLTSDNLVPLNSLYSDGMVFVTFIFFLAMCLRALVKYSKTGLGNIIPVFIAAYLFLTSNVSMPYLVIVLVPLIAYLVYINIPLPAYKLYHLFFSGVGMIVLIILSVNFLSKNEQLNARNNLYAATFYGAFAAADNKEEALNYFGLDSSLMEDIGKSYYLDESEYVVAPFTDAAEESIYSHISYGKLLKYYMTHPSTFVKIMEQVTDGTKKIDREKYRYIDTAGRDYSKETVERIGYYPLLRSIIAPNSISGLFTIIGVLLALCGGILLYFKRKKKELGFGMIYLIITIGIICIARILTTSFVYGTFDISSNVFSIVICIDIMFLAFISLCTWCTGVLSNVLNRTKDSIGLKLIPGISYAIIEGSPAQWIRKRIRQFKNFFITYVLNNKSNTTIFIGGLALLVMVLVMFIPERIGAYNNGDFGRMMDAMGLYYTDYDLLHQDEQYVTKVIENYTWLDTFDWSSVTSFNPTMSQVFLAVLVKLTAGAMGFLYNTAYATAIYVVLMTIGFTLFIYGCYKLMGRKSALLGGMLIVVLFGSYNLGWFNSLFSEATEMAGLILVMGFSMYMVAKDRGTVRWYEWLFFAASIRFFIGAKSQVTPEILFLGIWIIILAVYHKTKKTWKWVLQMVCVFAMVALTARSAVIIYQKDSAISSQDTTYSSVFSGVLMVADDPVKALDELGLDESLVEDTGKNPYLGEDAYYCAPRTQMADEMIYSKVNTFKILGWYLKHPDKLYYMLDHAAVQSAAAMPDYFLYVGEKTTEEHRTVSKFNLWSSLRQNVTPNAFWQYTLFYGIFVIFCLKQIFNKRNNGKTKLMAGAFLTLIFVGVMQFPLSVIGNGFIDNIKQLFTFRLIHDINFTVAVFLIMIWLKRFLGNETKKLLDIT